MVTLTLSDLMSHNNMRREGVAGRELGVENPRPWPDHWEPGRVTEARCTPSHSQGGRWHNVNSREPFLSLNIANTFALPPQDCHHFKNYRIVIEFKDHYQLAVSSRDSQEYLSRPVSGSSISWGHFHLGMNIKHLNPFSVTHCEYIYLSSKQNNMIYDS